MLKYINSSKPYLLYIKWCTHKVQPGPVSSPSQGTHTIHNCNSGNLKSPINQNMHVLGKKRSWEEHANSPQKEDLLAMRCPRYSPMPVSHSHSLHINLLEHPSIIFPTSILEIYFEIDGCNLENT